MYQIIYRLKDLIPVKRSYIHKELNIAGQLDFHCVSFINNNESLHGSTFTFLNLTHSFDDRIDWNYAKYGKLWTYNLNYFDFLLQKSMNKESGVILIKRFVSQFDSLKVGLEPYPTSLRVMNWVKFLIAYSIADASINGFILTDLQRLKERIEYHLMGNHLLENGFALLIGGIYLKNATFYNTGVNIVQRQLKEQVLNDGGHFELSPMYHQIILNRLLDAYNIHKANGWIQRADIDLLFRVKATKMLGWIKAMTFSNGEIPHVNDSASGIAPTTVQLENYALQLGIIAEPSTLSDSGYRFIKKDDLELLLDIGKIGPGYIPGHGHSDSLNFIMYWKEKPILVDTGTSTYERNKTRLQERSTSAHNTVELEGKSQSEVWSSFRVGRRAKCKLIEEDHNKLVASHDGYKKMNQVHTRTFTYTEDEIAIRDQITKPAEAIAYFHMHPDIDFSVVENEIYGDFGTIEFANYTQIEITEFEFANGFNSVQPSSVIKVKFQSDLFTKIKLKDHAFEGTFSDR